MDLEARNSLAEEHKEYAERLVSRVMRYLGISQDFRDDLKSAAYLALVESATLFQPDKARHFICYANPRIKGAIYRQLAHSTWYKRPNNKKKLKALEAEVAKAEGSEVVSTVSQALDRVATSVVSYSLTVCDELVQNVALSKDDPEDLIYRSQVSQLLADAIQKLPERERFVLEKYYFEDVSLQQVGLMFIGQDFWDEPEPPSKSWITRIHRKGLERLKYRLAAVDKE